MGVLLDVHSYGVMLAMVGCDEANSEPHLGKAMGGLFAAALAHRGGFKWQ